MVYYIKLPLISIHNAETDLWLRVYTCQRLVSSVYGKGMVAEEGEQER